MNLKNGKKLKNHGKQAILILCFLALFFLFESPWLTRLTFAVSQLDYPKITSESINPNYPIEKVSSPASQEKSRAPEPSSLFIILSGICGMIIRFAQRSFVKFKRASDLALSTLGLLIASPLLVFAAILIKLNSNGRVLYKQNRVGQNGKIFQIYKLRTMVINAEKNTGAIWAKENDPRITSVGRVLRKAHIDEIPQLINVIKGEMSIVGPRPERPELVRDLKVLICDYEKRLQIKPGITGIAQAWHKYDETIQDVKKKIKFDLLYIRKMCLLVDLRILAQTFVVVLTGKGAR
jgi:lipopolysaccharide/colanic/teichoic acid biosynthesis glycosyltransferase